MTFPCIKCKIHQYTNTQIHLHITFTHYIYKLHLHITFTLYIYTLHSVENLIFLSNNECHILTLCRMEKLTVVSKAKSSSLKLSNLHVADCNKDRRWSLTIRTSEIISCRLVCALPVDPSHPPWPSQLRLLCSLWWEDQGEPKLVTNDYDRRGALNMKMNMALTWLHHKYFYEEVH